MSSQSQDDVVAARQHHTFLSLPVEIRLKIYTLLFYCADALLIEPANPAYQQGFQNEYEPPPGYILSSQRELRIAPIQFCRPAYLTSPHAPNTYGLGLSSQLLMTNREIHSEALPLLYILNKFDCSLRSAPSILHRIISTPNFALIRHLILDWDQLQDFGWSLSKDDQVRATSGLEILQLNHFRTQIPLPTPREQQLMNISVDPPRAPVPGSRPWHSNREYEAQLHQAALEICEKHAQLRHVLCEMARKSQPRGFQREAIPAALSNCSTVARPIPELKVTSRIRWRFVTEKGLRKKREGEVVVDVVGELEALNVDVANGWAVSS